MNVFPAIDLLNGQSVRLYQGNYQKITSVAKDPVAQALSFQKAGLSRLHLVDLDGAKAGVPKNQEIVRKIRANCTLLMEIGGGIRTLATIETYLTMGINRVILGSSALTDPELVIKAIEQFGADQIVVGIDGQNGQVATEGWLTQSQVPMNVLMQTMSGVGVTRFIITDIQRDGTLTGPNIELLQTLQNNSPKTTVIASGGIGNYEDLKTLNANGLTNVIVGKALVKGTLTLEQLKTAEVTLC